MKKGAQKASARKPYEKPQIKRVKLETVERTLGTGCYGVGGILPDSGACQLPPGCGY